MNEHIFAPNEIALAFDYFKKRLNASENNKLIQEITIDSQHTVDQKIIYAPQRLIICLAEHDPNKYIAYILKECKGKGIAREAFSVDEDIITYNVKTQQLSIEKNPHPDFLYLHDKTYTKKTTQKSEAEREAALLNKLSQNSCIGPYELPNRQTAMFVKNAGESLANKIQKGELANTTTAQKIDIILQIIQQIKTIHEAGFYHLDLTLNNIGINNQNKIQFFDITTATPIDNLDFYLDMPKGTPLYYLNKPSEHTYCAHQDIHALMVCIFCILTEQLHTHHFNNPDPEVIRRTWGDILIGIFGDNTDSRLILLSQFLHTGLMYYYNSPAIRFTLEEIETFFKNFLVFSNSEKLPAPYSQKFNLIIKMQKMITPLLEIYQEDTRAIQIFQGLQTYIACSSPDSNECLALVWHFLDKCPLFNSIDKTLFDNIKQEIISYMPSEQLDSMLDKTLALYEKMTNSRNTLANDTKNLLQSKKEQIEALLNGYDNAYSLVHYLKYGTNSFLIELKSLEQKITLVQEPGNFTDIHLYFMQKNMEDYVISLDKKIKKFEKLLEKAQVVDELNTVWKEPRDIHPLWDDLVKTEKKLLNRLNTLIKAFTLNAELDTLIDNQHDALTSSIPPLCAVPTFISSPVVEPSARKVVESPLSAHGFFAFPLTAHYSKSANNHFLSQSFKPKGKGKGKVKDETPRAVEKTPAALNPKTSS